VLEFPAGNATQDEDLELAAARELSEETGYVLAPDARMRPLGAFYSLPSETNKYTHVFLASPVTADGPASGDTEIEKYFDMSVTTLPLSTALDAVGDAIAGTETITALMLARAALRGDPEVTALHAGAIAERLCVLAACTSVVPESGPPKLVRPESGPPEFPSAPAPSGRPMPRRQRQQGPPGPLPDAAPRASAGPLPAQA
jgi:ADP-ribose pyrophosphatase YjhB (NUDIX family)